ncbi:MAG TPA: glycosyltransferase family 2 protein, partial [Polyangia bacterium]|nr:glycosyltransferase family 2 protein [Polyangia bacterium]
MIVKNEAELLPRFLAAAAGLWDDLCVVDTGSRDGTVAILEAAGARVFHRAWDDDFSAARNAGLDHATGDWVLFLDADEMASPELAAQVRALLDDDGAGAAMIIMRNLLPHGHRRDTPMLRLFRNDPAIRFSYPIHEDITAAVSRYLARTGRKLRRLGAIVDHLGYVRERATSRQKKSRDMSLLMRSIERDPTDFYSWFKLLELARFWRDRALWSEAALSACRALEAAGPLALSDKQYGGEMIVLIADGLHSGDAPTALSFIGGWADLVPPSAALFLRRAELNEVAGDAAAAAADFARCRDLEDQTGDIQLATVRPLMGLARLAIAAGDIPKATRRVEQALAENPRDPEALLLSVFIARARGGAAAVAELAARLRAQYGDSSELHEALGEAALLAGLGDEAVAELRQVAGDPPEGRVALRLAQALLAAGALDDAVTLAASLVPSLPEAGLGILVCNLCRGRDSDLHLDVDPAVADQALRSWVDVLKVGRPEHLAGFRHHV